MHMLSLWSRMSLAGTDRCTHRDLRTKTADSAVQSFRSANYSQERVTAVRIRDI